MVIFRRGFVFKVGGVEGLSWEDRFFGEFCINIVFVRVYFNFDRFSIFFLVR